MSEHGRESNVSEIRSQAMAEYPVRVREPLAPNAEAPMPFKATRAARIVDVIGLPSNVAVIQARMGRVRYSREEMKTPFAEYLALEPCEVNAGTYCVFTVMNVGSKPVDVAGRVLVEGEHGPAVEALPLREVTAEDSTSPAPPARDGAASRRNAANDAMVDAIIDNAAMPDGRPVKSAKSAKPAKTARRPAPTPSTVPLARSLKPLKIMTRHARRARYEALENEAKNASADDVELRSVVLHIGNVAMLDLMLNASVPMTEDARAEISAALAGGRQDSKPSHVGEVVVRLAVHDLRRLIEAIETRAEYTLEDTGAMRAAIQAVLKDPNAGLSDAVTRAADEWQRREEAFDAEAKTETTVTSVETAALAPVEEAEVGKVTLIHERGRAQQRAPRVRASAERESEALVSSSERVASPASPESESETTVSPSTSKEKGETGS